MTLGSPFIVASVRSGMAEASGYQDRTAKGRGGEDGEEVWDRGKTNTWYSFGKDL